MQQGKLMSTTLAARRALAAQQIRALRDWLGEDHELLASGPPPKPVFSASDPLRQPASAAATRREVTA
jgi:hypothetical protein